MQIAISKLARKFWATDQVRAEVVAETVPGFDTVPMNATDAQWAAWIRNAGKCVALSF